MTGHLPNPDGEPKGASGSGHETDGTSVTGVVLSVVALVVFLVGALFAVWGLLGTLRVDRPATPAGLAAEAVDPGPARHWENPAADLAAMRAREDARLDGYRWIDRERGIVQIPIERAMALVAERAGNGPDDDGS